MADLTITDWKTYAAAREQSAVAAEEDDNVLTAALLRGRQSTDARYTGRFPGAKAGGRAQEPAWPRTGASDRDGNAIANDETPDEYVHACFEMALRELTSPGSTHPDFTPNTQVKKLKKGIGPLSKETEYRDAGAEGALPVYALIDRIIAPILKPEGGTMTMMSVGGGG